MEQEFGYQRKSNRQNNNYIFEDGLMLTYCRHNMVLITQVFNTETWQEETQPRSDGFSQFCGILHHASVPGLSDLISVYIHFNKTILMDLRTGDTVQLDVDGTDKARLTRGRTGIILRSGLTGGGYYLYDGEKTEKYEPLPEEEIHDDRRDYRFGERWVYFEDGVFHDSETGEKLLDCKGKDLTVKSASENGSCLLLQKGKDRMLILRYLDNSELLELAGTTLEGRELTETQRQAYFLE